MEIEKYNSLKRIEARMVSVTIYTILILLLLLSITRKFVTESEHTILFSATAILFGSIIFFKFYFFYKQNQNYTAAKRRIENINNWFINLPIEKKEQIAKKGGF